MRKKEYKGYREEVGKSGKRAKILRTSLKVEGAVRIESEDGSLWIRKETRRFKANADRLID